MKAELEPLLTFILTFLNECICFVAVTWTVSIIWTFVHCLDIYYAALGKFFNSLCHSWLWYRVKLANAKWSTKPCVAALMAKPPQHPLHSSVWIELLQDFRTHIKHRLLLPPWLFLHVCIFSLAYGIQLCAQVWIHCLCLALAPWDPSHMERLRSSHSSVVNKQHETAHSCAFCNFSA